MWGGASLARLRRLEILGLWVAFVFLGGGGRGGASGCMGFRVLGVKAHGCGVKARAWAEGFTLWGSWAWGLGLGHTIDDINSALPIIRNIP